MTELSYQMESQVLHKQANEIKENLIQITHQIDLDTQSYIYQTKSEKSQQSNQTMDQQNTCQCQKKLAQMFNSADKYLNQTLIPFAQPMDPKQKIWLKLLLQQKQKEKSIHYNFYLKILQDQQLLTKETKKCFKNHTISQEKLEDKIQQIQDILLSNYSYILKMAQFYIKLKLSQEEFGQITKIFLQQIVNSGYFTNTIFQKIKEDTQLIKQLNDVLTEKELMKKKFGMFMKYVEENKIQFDEKEIKEEMDKLQQRYENYSLNVYDKIEKNAIKN